VAPNPASLNSEATAKACHGVRYGSWLCAFSHSQGQIRPSCLKAAYGSSSSDSCRSSRMPATAESGHKGHIS